MGKPKAQGSLPVTQRSSISASSSTNGSYGESDHVYCVVLHVVEAINFHNRETRDGEREQIVMNAALNSVDFEVEGTPSVTAETIVFNSNCIWECDMAGIKRIKTDHRPVKVTFYACSIGAERQTIGSLLLPVRGLPVLGSGGNNNPLQLKMFWHKLICISNEFRSHKPEVLLMLAIIKKSLLGTKDFKHLMAFSCSEKSTRTPPLQPPGHSITANMLQSQANVYVQSLVQLGLLQVGNDPLVDCDIIEVVLQLKQLKNVNKFVKSLNLAKDTETVMLMFDFVGNITHIELKLINTDSYTLNDVLGLRFKSSLRSMRLYFQRIFYLPINMYINGISVANYRMDFGKILPSDSYFVDSRKYETNGCFAFERFGRNASARELKPIMDYTFTVEIKEVYWHQDKATTQQERQHKQNQLDEDSVAGKGIESELSELQCYNNCECQNVKTKDGSLNVSCGLFESIAEDTTSEASLSDVKVHVTKAVGHSKKFTELFSKRSNHDSEDEESNIYNVNSESNISANFGNNNSEQHINDNNSIQENGKDVPIKEAREIKMASTSANIGKNCGDLQQDSASRSPSNSIKMHFFTNMNTRKVEQQLNNIRKSKKISKNIESLQAEHESENFKFEKKNVKSKTGGIYEIKLELNDKPKKIRKKNFFQQQQKVDEILKVKPTDKAYHDKYLDGDKNTSALEDDIKYFCLERKCELKDGEREKSSTQIMDNNTSDIDSATDTDSVEMFVQESVRKQVSTPMISEEYERSINRKTKNPDNFLGARWVEVNKHQTKALENTELFIKQTCEMNTKDICHAKRMLYNRDQASRVGNVKVYPLDQACANRAFNNDDVEESNMQHRQTKRMIGKRRHIQLVSKETEVRSMRNRSDVKYSIPLDTSQADNNYQNCIKSNSNSKAAGLLKINTSPRRKNSNEADLNVSEDQKVIMQEPSRVSESDKGTELSAHMHDIGKLSLEETISSRVLVAKYTDQSVNTDTNIMSESLLQILNTSNQLPDEMQQTTLKYLLKLSDSIAEQKFETSRNNDSSIDVDYKLKLNTLEQQLVALQAEMLNHLQQFESRSEIMQLENLRLAKEKSELKQRINQMEQQIAELCKPTVKTPELDQILNEARTQSNRILEMTKAKDHYRKQWRRCAKRVHTLKLTIYENNLKNELQSNQVHVLNLKSILTKDAQEFEREYGQFRRQSADGVSFSASSDSPETVFKDCLQRLSSQTLNNLIPTDRDDSTRMH
ncbi:uncharacterized protein LOC108604427 isoform X2 [Drosophila busckii]|uniref:uncharacterized protein LOC108604427 isoform X2 n=1 Tax=Drosophila busckii TaxID=30019 RepID=UPI00083EBA52|nr:uncharacterized protein LOC108604427 isoform X2 [Drosophila busckii]